MTIEPINKNYLQETNYRFFLKKTPALNYFCTGVSMPSLTMNSIDMHNPFQKIPETGVQATFDQLTINFIIDEEMENYLEIQKWMYRPIISKRFFSVQRTTKRSCNSKSKENSKIRLHFIHSYFTQ